MLFLIAVHSVFVSLRWNWEEPCLKSLENNNQYHRADAQRGAAHNRMASTSLIHETDLVVSINDLDNLFNSDEDDLAVSRDPRLTQLHVFWLFLLSVSTQVPVDSSIMIWRVFLRPQPGSKRPANGADDKFSGKEAKPSTLDTVSCISKHLPQCFPSSLNLDFHVSKVSVNLTFSRITTS